MNSVVPKNEFIKSWSDNGVGWVQLNHENKLNPLSAGFILAIKEATEKFDNDLSVGCIVLTGSEKAFAAGADLKEMVKHNYASVSETRYIENGWLDIPKIQTPIIAGVKGYALGGGCELAMMCDFIIASENAQFGQPEINIGAIPGAGGTQRLTRSIGKSKAMLAILTGDMMSADEAEKSGLVAKVISNDKFDVFLKEIAKKIANQSKPLAKLAKQAVNVAYETTLEEGIRSERALFYSTFALEDHVEGMEAFSEKRKPIWNNK
ncbi:enoyl-CoA hydratase-related protein [Alphaproteobacteria bacterium]|nr:enoyl-CoA hydratase-related protein [Alphaproteobacteria bacterium]